MMYRTKCLVPVIGMSVAACAGELSDPERFEVGQSAASAAGAGHTGAGQEPLPPKPPAQDPPVAGSDAGTSTCGSTTELLAAKCATAGCHGAASPAAGLDLKSTNLGARLRDVAASAACEGYALIDGNDPARSLLYLVKIFRSCRAGARECRG